MVENAADPPKQIRARLRGQIRLTAMSGSDDGEYVLDDPITSRYYRIGAREYALLNCLSDYTALADAFLAVNERLGRDSFSEEDFAAVVEWLQTEQLLDVEGQAGEVPPSKPADPARWLNLITFRIPFGNPERLLDRLLPLCGFVTGRWFFALWLLCGCSALVVIATNWAQFSAAASGIFYVNNWLTLMVVWTCVKILHELCHGIVCKRFGGHVYEAGVILILFIPIGYVDATSSWRFQHRWQRVLTALAGMYIELFIAAIATWVWILSEPGLLNDLAYKTIILASVTTLLFNANPLMRFDGYFALTDIARSPNLYTHGRRYVFYLVRRYLMGERIDFDHAGINHLTFVKSYGVLAFFWRTAVMVTLIIAAHSMFRGAGVVIAVAALAGIFVVPMWRNAKMLGAGREPSQNLFALARSCSALTLLFVAAYALRWQSDIVVPAVVEFADHQVIRAQSEGFVAHVNVAAGDVVTSNALIARVRNPLNEQRLRQLAIEIEQTKIRIRIEQNAKRSAAVANERKNLEQLRRLFEAAQDKANRLSILATSDGIVVGDGLSSLAGRYLAAGEAIGELIESERKELRISIDQRSMNDVDLETNQRIPVLLKRSGDRVREARIDHIKPRFSTVVEYPHLSGANGGPLPVHLGRASANGKDARLEYIEPRGTVTALLEKDASESLYAGEIAYVRLPGKSISLAERIVRRVETWLERVMSRAQSVEAARA